MYVCMYITRPFPPSEGGDNIPVVVIGQDDTGQRKILPKAAARIQNQKQTTLNPENDVTSGHIFRILYFAISKA